MQTTSPKSARKRFFGTDGIRGKANVAPLDPVTLVEIGSVLGRLMRERGGIDGGILIAHDGRRSADMIFASLSAGLCAEGVEVFEAGLLTTPALAHESRLGAYQAGVMISASHNPAEDNGIKLFGANGQKIADEIEHAIEEELSSAIDAVRAEPACIRRIAAHGRDGAPGYRAFLHETFPDLDLSGLRILVDCAHGAGSKLAPRVLEDFGATVIALNIEPDGSNINKNCGALHPEAIAAEVASQGCALGLCLDGDGDRSIFVDETGQVVDGDALLTLLALELERDGRLAQSTIAVTVMSNLGLKQALSQAQITIRETPVGDRAVSAAMQEHDLVLGGENSGHIIFGQRHHYTGDGLFTTLELMGILQARGAALSELTSAFERCPQKLVNVSVRNKPALDSVPEIVAAKQRVEQTLGDEGRVVLRYSGTEQLCRVMIEALRPELVDDAIAALVQAVEKSIGA